MFVYMCVCLENIMARNIRNMFRIFLASVWCWFCHDQTE